MRTKNIDLMVAVIIAMSNGLCLFLPLHVPIACLILAMPLIFILPGYTLIEVLFHKRTFETVEHVLFSLAVSMAIDVVGGLSFNLFSLRLEPASWVVFLALLTIGFSFIASMMRRGIIRASARLPMIHCSPGGYLLFILAGTIVLLSMLFSAIGAMRQPYPGFTQLWMLPSTHTSEGCAVKLGVDSFENTAVTYRIVVTINGAQLDTWLPVTLAPRKTWNQVVPVAMHVDGAVLVEARLYRLDKPASVYRRVHLTLHRSIGGKDGRTQLCGTSSNIDHS